MQNVCAISMLLSAPSYDLTEILRVRIFTFGCHRYGCASCAAQMPHIGFGYILTACVPVERPLLSITPIIVYPLNTFSKGAPSVGKNSLFCRAQELRLLPKPYSSWQTYCWSLALLPTHTLRQRRSMLQPSLAQLYPNHQ